MQATTLKTRFDLRDDFGQIDSLMRQRWTPHAFHPLIRDVGGQKEPRFGRGNEVSLGDDNWDIRGVGAHGSLKLTHSSCVKPDVYCACRFLPAQQG